MRVALVILHADPGRGGAERYTIQLAEALIEAGHDVALLCADAEEAPVRSATRAQRVALAYTPPTRTFRYWTFCRSLARHLPQNRYDIVHAMLPVPPGLCDLYHPHAGVAARRTGPVYTRLINPRRHVFAAVERRLLESQRPPIVLTLSGYVEQQLRTYYPELPANCVSRLFNAVDLARFDPDGPAVDRRELGAESGDLLALFVGNDFVRKGLGVVLEGLPALPPFIRLAVAGEDEESAGFIRRTQAMGLRERVRFLGRRNDLPALYRAADVLVLPTRHDPCSLVLLEALACGLPAISTRQNGATEIMTHGQHGYILQGPRDPELGVCLLSMADPERRATMRAACLALRPALSWERHLQTLLEIYQGCQRRAR